jgi:tRNA (cytidine32/uridine32-2'-O)-methyltransferase
MSPLYDNMPEYSSAEEKICCKIFESCWSKHRTGNMGSVARAMKTMGLTNLWLVNPLVNRTRRRSPWRPVPAM